MKPFISLLFSSLLFSSLLLIPYKPFAQNTKLQTQGKFSYTVTPVLQIQPSGGSNANQPLQPYKAPPPGTCIEMPRPGRKYNVTPKMIAEKEASCNPNQTENSINRTSAGITPIVGRNSVGNNMAFGTPPDNTMAISDNGFIVSADNYTIEYYNQNIDTLRKWTTYPQFYGIQNNI